MDRLPRLSLDLLRGFRAAARHLSFTQAARELNVTPSAVSREVKTLEEQLGTPLFHRVNRALQLTGAGIELSRAADQALDLVDGAIARLAGASRSLGVTTTTAFGSLWLVPRLPGYARDHGGRDVRIVATNEIVDLERERLDVAIRYVPPDAPVPGGERLVEYETFPVCAPALANEGRHPLRVPADLARHVRLDFEAVLYGRPWSDWDHWFAAVGQAPIAPVATMRFSHYDQVIQAAIEGAGVAIGKKPHLLRHLRDGTLCAPFGRECISHIGGFDIVVAPSARGRGDVQTFVAWLRDEMRRDEAQTPAAFRRQASRPTGKAGAAGRRAPKNGNTHA